MTCSAAADDVRVVLDDDDRVADVLQRSQDLHQAEVVAGVEPDRRLVEDEERPHEGGAEGRGQADALGLAAAQSEGHAVESDVVEPDLHEEAQAGPDLLDQLLGHLALVRLEREPGEEGRGLADGHADDLADVEALDANAQGPGVETGLGAGRAGDVFPVTAEEDPDLDLVFLGLEPIEEALDAVVAVAAFEDEALMLGAKVAEGDVRRDLPAAGLGQKLLLHALGQGLRPGLDRALLQALRAVGDDLVLVDDGQVAEAVALGAGAVGAVEREEIRIGVLGREPAGPALELLGEAELTAAFGPDEDAALALLEADLERVGQPLPLVDAERDPVDEDVDGRGALGDGVEVDDGPVDDRPGEAVLFEDREAAGARPREGDQGAGPGGLSGQLGDHAVDRVAEDGAAALKAVDRPDAGEEDAEEIEDLGDRGHGRARVLGGALLLDGDGREGCPR